jgi:DNA-binding response OmpR family regulator
LTSDRILIVDDNRDHVLLLKGFLVPVTEETLGITDSRAAEKAFIEFKPDLVFLDLHMTDPDGFEVMRQLQSHRKGDVFVPIIVLTADVTKATRNKALELGANDFLTKPVDPIEAVLRARNLLRTRHLVLGEPGID